MDMEVTGLNLENLCVSVGNILNILNILNFLKFGPKSWQLQTIGWSFGCLSISGIPWPRFDWKRLSSRCLKQQKRKAHVSLFFYCTNIRWRKEGPCTTWIKELQPTHIPLTDVFPYSPSGLFQPALSVCHHESL